ncbi:hypothetical protein [Streptomyces racemochromogenes]|uniref:hypothetical protein n=1 Tax=Streptomyces racemochromogenes TaxID=67353 RepID=UPI0031EC9041
MDPLGAAGDAEVPLLDGEIEYRLDGFDGSLDLATSDAGEGEVGLRAGLVAEGPFVLRGGAVRGDSGLGLALAECGVRWMAARVASPSPRRAWARAERQASQTLVVPRTLPAAPRPSVA